MKYGEGCEKKKADKTEAKNNEKVAESKNSIDNKIDYVELFNQMNEMTFNLCVDRLFPLFNYCVITREDIRKVDILEQLVRMQNKYYEDNKGKSEGYLNYYMSILQRYYDDLIRCKKDSRAERCKNRGHAVIKNALNSYGTTYDIEDSVVLFLCLFREMKDKIADKDFELSDVSVAVGINDVELLNHIVDYEFQTSVGLVKKPGILDKLKLSDDSSEYEAKVLFINSVIFLCLGLQDRGAFEDGDSE